MLRTHTLPAAGVLLVLLSTPALAARLGGSVSSSPGHPIVNAKVVLEGPTGPVATTRTTPSGTFVLEAPEGDYTLRVVAEGFDAPPRQVTLRDAADASADVTMGVAALAEQVVVSAGFVPLTRSASGATLTVLDEAELRTRQLESAQDALRSVPGFTVARSGGRGAVTSVFPRGGESDFTLVMVDGIRLNDMGGSFDAAHLPLFDLDRIEHARRGAARPQRREVILERLNGTLQTPLDISEIERHLGHLPTPGIPVARRVESTAARAAFFNPCRNTPQRSSGAASL